MAGELGKGSEVELKLPVRKAVARVLVSRYGAGKRPVSWDERFPGLECVVSQDGRVILLSSNGQQSSPAPGWDLLLTGEREIPAEHRPKLPDGTASPAVAYTWTLYGIAKGAPLGKYESLSGQSSR